MRTVKITVLLLLLSPLLHACPVPLVGCGREDAPEFSATAEEVTRETVIAALGAPVETVVGQDRRADIYEYDGHCVGLFWLLPIPYPLPILGERDQMLVVEYGQKDSFLSAEVWPRTETPDEVIAAYWERWELDASCETPVSLAAMLDASTLYELGYDCSDARQREADPSHWKWICLAAHGRHSDAQRRLGILRLHHSRDTPTDRRLVQAYKWLKLAMNNDGKGSLVSLSERMTLSKVIEAERLAAEWVPNPEECKELAAPVETRHGRRTKATGD